MYAYELLPKLIYLTLTGQDDKGNLEFWGTDAHWKQADLMEQEMYG